MRTPRPKTLFLPVLGLLAAVLVLLTIVAVTTYYNLDRGGKQAWRVLSTQSSAIVSGLVDALVRLFDQCQAILTRSRSVLRHSPVPILTFLSSHSAMA